MKLDVCGRPLFANPVTNNAAYVIKVSTCNKSYKNNVSWLAYMVTLLKVEDSHLRKLVFQHYPDPEQTSWL